MLRRQHWEETNERIGHPPSNLPERKKQKLETEAAPPGRSQRGNLDPGGVGEEKKVPL